MKEAFYYGMAILFSPANPEIFGGVLVDRLGRRNQPGRHLKSLTLEQLP
jgi:hypothetical protein